MGNYSTNYIKMALAAVSADNVIFSTAAGFFGTCFTFSHQAKIREVPVLVLEFTCVDNNSWRP